MSASILLGFYNFDVSTHIFGSVISFLLSFYFHRMFSISQKKSYKRLRTGFLLLSIGLVVLAISNTITHTLMEQCPTGYENGALCQTHQTNILYSLENFSYFMYFGISLIAYLHIIMAYGVNTGKFGPEFYDTKCVRSKAGSKKEAENALWDDDYENEGARLKYPKIFLFLFFAYVLLIIALLPASRTATARSWLAYDSYFALIASIISIYICLKNIINYGETKCSNTILVAASFGFLFLSNLLDIFSFLNERAYVLSHIFMLVGFLILLIMVLRATKRFSGISLKPALPDNTAVIANERP